MEKEGMPIKLPVWIKPKTLQQHSYVVFAKRHFTVNLTELSCLLFWFVTQKNMETFTWLLQILKNQLFLQQLNWRKKEWSSYGSLGSDSLSQNVTVLQNTITQDAI